jgi:hypothetical protein
MTTFSLPAAHPWLLLDGFTETFIRPFFFRSPRSTTTKGGEHMMIATLLIGTTSLVAMVTGFIVMIRD